MDILKTTAKIYKETIEECKNLENYLIETDRKMRETFGSLRWFEAINKIPFTEENGELKINAGANIHDVVECLLDLAISKECKVKTKFNGTILDAEPNDTIENIYRRFDERRRNVEEQL